MDAANVIKVMLVDNHRLMRAGIRALIEKRPPLMVVGESAIDGNVIELVTREKPDIILVDVDGQEPPTIIAELLGAARSAQIIALMSDHNDSLCQEAVQLGAQGVVLKNQEPETLVSAIEKVHSGEVWLNRAMVANVLSALRQPTPPPTMEEIKIQSLTERELDVIGMIGKGLKNQEISERLHISESTVRHHLTSIYSKLEVSDRLELLIFAYRESLLDPHCK